MSDVQAVDAGALHVQGLGKEYKIYASPKDRLLALLTGRQRHTSHWALRDVSFALRRGECLGVIGDNGAGKSTLLKLMAGTIQPTQGRIERVGRVTAILELGAGFHPDFSGRENLYFGGSLIGISAAEMARLEAGIIEFSELGDAIDRAVKTYSSGMVVRLAFALVTAVRPELLIIDEALAVGDQSFQKKCVQRIEDFRQSGCTIMFCSHSSYHIRHLCDRALWMQAGRVRAFGATEAVLGAYETFSRQRGQADVAQESGASPSKERARVVRRQAGEGSRASILSVVLSNLDETEAPPRLDDKDLVVTITVQGFGEERPNIGFMLEQSKGSGITSLATHEEGAVPTSLGEGRWRSVLRFPDLPLHTGEYVVSAYLFDASGLVLYDYWIHYKHFKFVSPTLMPGLVRLPHVWS
ncbi:ABC transporter ATP-binding protein [Ramlibacter sp. H39-3-26]|uniref:ABC transporter ATP-binding protein n=1 Tax=Curvibacter soli TaxID=3031331 RepID=UPI0023D97EC7|nr:ABC transporter ATP-binding protein [Ramlibacter sp. H39-3-26]MDF1486397.1 ABC transporter ATP-binding protein [Ramlibacter sp. H39-3-26]